MFNAAFVSSPGEGRTCFESSDIQSDSIVTAKRPELVLPACGEK
jgi:hypothetical protein